jgi:hypothetical protein
MIAHGLDAGHVITWNYFQAKCCHVIGPHLCCQNPDLAAGSIIPAAGSQINLPLNGFLKFEVQ